MKLYFKLPIFLIIIALISFGLIKNYEDYNTAVEATNQQALLDYTIEQKEGNIEDYVFFIHSGYYHLNRNELNSAQREFTRALWIDEYGKGARIGLTRTLVAQCEGYQKECEKIKENLDFLRAMKYLPNSEIEKMEDQYVYDE